MRIKKVELHAFRAYKNKENGTFDFTLSDDKIANFISIYAPNGFGKTSFYDGVEWAITNNISRFNTYTDIADSERKFVEKINGRREKQYILKNKFVEDKEEGYVNIWTNGKEFEKKIPSIQRAGGKDYFSNTQINNKYFKDVILSQDGIDNFLKADDDKERYKKFISHFGDTNIGNYYNNIRELEKKNKKEIEEIKKGIDKLTKDLRQKIDDSIFESTNESIEKINLNSTEKLTLINEDFDAIKKGELATKLSQQKKDLNTGIEHLENFMIPKIPSWLENSKKYFKDKLDWEKLKNKLDSFIELEQTINDIKIIQNKISINTVNKEELEKLNKIYPLYKAIKKEIDKIENHVKNLNYEKTKDESSISEIEIDFSKVSTEIDFLEKEKKELDELLLNIPILYENIKKVQKYDSDIKTFEASLIKYENIRKAIKSNIFIVIRSDEKYKLKVENIESLIHQNTLNEEKSISLENKKTQYQQYNREIRDLISLGIQIIDKTGKDTCPLCDTKQDSYEVLRNKVLNNPLLNTLEKELFAEEEKIFNSIKTNNQKIEEYKKSITTGLNKDINEIKNKIVLLNYKIRNISFSLGKEQEKLLSNLITQTERMSQDELHKIKTKKQLELEGILDKLAKKKDNLTEENKKKKENILFAKEALAFYNKNLNELKKKEEYLAIYNYVSNFESQINVLESITNNIERITKIVNEKNTKLNSLEDKKLEIVNQYSIENLDNLNEEVELLKDKEFNFYSKNIFLFESGYEGYFQKKITILDNVKEDIKSKQEEWNSLLSNNKKRVNLIEIIENNTDNLLKFIENKKLRFKLKEYKKEVKVKSKVATKLSNEKRKLEDKINKDVEEFFHEELINKIYEKIDPHPDYKKVKFECHFENSEGKLNVFVDNDNGTKHISPTLYYSTAQLNVLSLSIFLAKALHTKDDEGNNVDCIFIDDPIQSMDSINILSTIDLLRSFVVNHNKQIILSTHDENFHHLLKKKIPTEYFDSKFIELETYGKVKKH